MSEHKEVFDFPERKEAAGQLGPGPGQTQDRQGQGQAGWRGRLARFPQGVWIFLGHSRSLLISNPNPTSGDIHTRLEAPTRHFWHAGLSATIFVHSL